MEFIRLTEKDNAVDSLLRAAKFLDETKSDPLAWKWFAISLHHALHSFMLVALKNPDGSGIWRDPVIFRDNGTIDIFHKENKLIDFPTAYRYIKNPSRMSGYDNAKHFQSKPYHDQTVKMFNSRLRNELMHYRPHGLSISKEFFIDLSLPILEIIRFLIFKSGRCFYEDEQIEKSRSTLDELSTTMATMKNDFKQKAT